MNDSRPDVPMKHVLVTGGAGFIGSNFVRYLLRTDPAVRVVTLDALTYAGSLENLQRLPGAGRHVFVRGDICDGRLVDELLRGHEIDTIVHFAAETHVDRSILDPAPFLRTNVLGTWTLLESARRYRLEEKQPAAGRVRFHHVSTDEVYGSLEPDAPPFSETSPYAPSSPYAASKASADHLVRSYGRTYRLPVTISNCSNNYGPRQFPEKLIPLTISNAVAGRPLPVYGDGGQIRDWLFVEDHCEAIHRILLEGRPGQTYHAGGLNQLSNLTMIEAICDMLDEFRPLPGGASHRQLIRFVGDRPGHDRRYAMDIARIRKELGWAPRHSLDSGLRATVEWYLEHPDWVDAIRNRDDYRSWVETNYDQR